MRNTISVVLGVLIISASIRADTIYLKNGSIIKGKVTNFSDDQFVVLMNPASERPSRATIYVGDVGRIEFESSAAAAETASQRDTAPTTLSESAPTVEVGSRDAAQQRDIKRDATPKESGSRDERSTTVGEISEPVRQAENAGLNSTPPETTKSNSRKPAGQVRTTVVDVAAKRDWTSTGLIVKKGDVIRISASGSVTLDPATGQSSDPDGIDTPDAKKLMGDKPTGSLIAVIGADNDEFIFIGKSTEFSVRRDGLLFLSVNEGTLSDNAGSYKATIELQTRSSVR